VSIVGTTVEEVHCDGAHFRRDVAAKVPHHGQNR